jgi:hypothetical protein
MFEDAQRGNNRLSNGLVVRPVKGKFTQIELFRLKGRIPKHESIMNVRELDDALNVRGVWKVIDVNGSWRTNRYGVYARGFERELDKPVGASIVWIEDGISYTFEVPDLEHPNDSNRGLRQATGMLDFALEKLQFDEDRGIVSITSDFDPESDVTVRNIMRPRGWALVDVEGYPLRTRPSDPHNSISRYSYVRHSDQFDREATGWHGSISRIIGIVDDRRYVYAYVEWGIDYGVAVVTR